ncbi:hypothetical protein BJX99DRAFT_258861 [Aspergillus californicus]
MPEADRTDLQSWKQRGFTFTYTEAYQSLRMASPTHRFLRDGIDQLVKDIKALETHPDYTRIKAEKDKGEFVNSIDERERKTEFPAIAKYKGDREFLKSFSNSGDYLLGRTCAASGLREVGSTSKPGEKSIRDWALIHPRISGPPEYPVPSHLTHSAREDPELDEFYFKFGHATGFTAAKYGNLKTCKIAISPNHC